MVYRGVCFQSTRLLKDDALFFWLPGWRIKINLNGSVVLFCFSIPQIKKTTKILSGAFRDLLGTLLGSLGSQPFVILAKGKDDDDDEI